MPRIQLKLMAGLAIVVLLTVLTSGYLAERGLRQRSLEELEASIARRARLVVAMLGERRLERDQSAELSALARRAARAAEARVTLMAPDGIVVADSNVPAAELARVENHASRPEMQAALRGDPGISTRVSATVGRPLLYLAIPAGRPERGVVRLAVELPDVEEAAAELRRELLVAGGIGLVAALGLSLLLSWISLRAFGELRQVLQALAGGELGRRLHWHVRDERQDIAESVNTMATQLEQRVRELTADREQLRRLEGMRRDFVANASHELRTPVTAIRGFAELLATREIPEEERKKQLEIVHQHAERLSALIDDLLELSRIESGGLQLTQVDVDVRKAAQALISDLGPMFARRSIDAMLDDGEAPRARVDPGALAQVLRNLLDNAAKYTDPGGRVRVSIRPAGDRVRIDVQDTGIGIPKAQQARIFERFYRVDAARSRALGGTGLGLAIVKHLVQACGGEVFLESQPGRGSTFSVTLPRSSA